MAVRSFLFLGSSQAELHGACCWIHAELRLGLCAPGVSCGFPSLLTGAFTLGEFCPALTWGSSTVLSFCTV